MLLDSSTIPGVPAGAVDRWVLAIVEDYELVSLGVRQILATHSAHVALVDLDAPTDPRRPRQLVDIVLVDPAVAVAHENKIAELVAEQCITHVVVFSWTLDDAAADRALRLGVHGYLSKSLPAAELVDALERIHAGEVVVNRPPPNGESGSPRPGLSTIALSEREAEVLRLIVQGRSNHEIAETCQLSANTLKSYIRSLYRKIGVSTRPQAVVKGLNTNLFRPPTQRPRSIDVDRLRDKTQRAIPQDF